MTSEVFLDNDRHLVVQAEIYWWVAPTNFMHGGPQSASSNQQFSLYVAYSIYVYIYIIRSLPLSIYGVNKEETQQRVITLRLKDESIGACSGYYLEELFLPLAYKLTK